MTDLSYKVLKNGLVQVFRGKERMVGPWLDMPVPLAARKALRAKLDPDMVLAAWIIFGTRCSPGDLNELHTYRKLVKQVMSDAPRMLPLIYAVVRDGNLKATPVETVLQRWKAVLMREGFQRYERSWRGGYPMEQPQRRNSDVNRFWDSMNQDKPAFTEAGWRYLTRMSLVSMREVAQSPWRLRDSAGAYNVLAGLGYPDAPDFVISLCEALGRLEEKGYDNAASRAVLVALKPVLSTPRDLLYQQCDLVRDWLTDTMPEVWKDTRWDTLVARALDYRLQKENLSRALLKDLNWTAPIAPFVANDGICVTPLLSGEQLLDEGLAMMNCLRNTKSYAISAVQGKSLVFSLQGVEGRASVEFTRSHPGAPWFKAQAEEPDGKPVTKKALLRAIDMLVDKMKGGSSWALAA